MLSYPSAETVAHGKKNVPPQLHETRSCAQLGRTLWKKRAGYHVQSRVEAQMNRLKLFGVRIMSRDPDGQTAEIQIRIVIMTRFSALDRAEFEAIALKRRGKGDHQPER